MTEGQKIVLIICILLLLFSYVTREESVDVVFPRMWRKLQKLFRRKL